MQSGISTSKELHTAFQSLLSDPSQRGLIATISTSSESLVPAQILPSTSTDLVADLANLEPLLTDTAAAYVILRQHGDTVDGQAKYVAVTYVPDKAPVRQKTLFASTRLTLVRELGTEHFSTTRFATSKDELTPAGWARHEAHEQLAAPLTEEERNLQDIKAAEASESRGTAARPIAPHHSIPVTPEAVEALKGLKEGREALVQLQIDIPSETITLASAHASVEPAELCRVIEPKAPRYSFYAYPAAAGADSAVLFVYTCPDGSSIKQRMMYASTRADVVAIAARQAGVVVKRKMETSSASEVTEEVVRDAMEEGGVVTAAEPVPARGFARPKGPGKR